MYVVSRVSLLRVGVRVDTIGSLCEWDHRQHTFSYTLSYSLSHTLSHTLSTYTPSILSQYTFSTHPQPTLSTHLLNPPSHTPSLTHLLSHTLSTHPLTHPLITDHRTIRTTVGSQWLRSTDRCMGRPCHCHCHAVDPLVISPHTSRCFSSVYLWIIHHGKDGIISRWQCSMWQHLACCVHCDMYSSHCSYDGWIAVSNTSYHNWRKSVHIPGRPRKKVYPLYTM